MISYEKLSFTFVKKLIHQPEDLDIYKKKKCF